MQPDLSPIDQDLYPYSDETPALIFFEEAALFHQFHLLLKPLDHFGLQIEDVGKVC
jgi:hypothetical protein